MEIVEKYSHLNGEEYLIVHHNDIYEEIREVISRVDAGKCKTKVSKERGRKGKLLYSPDGLNDEFERLFVEKGWESKSYHYYVTTDYALAQELIPLSLKEQKELLIESGVELPVRSYKQTDFVKENIAIEVQFGKYFAVAYDLFVKHLFFYSGGVIDVGVEIIPMRLMRTEMSSGVCCYEVEVHNVLRHGRSSPAVPLLIIGVAPEREEESGKDE